MAGTVKLLNASAQTVTSTVTLSEASLGGHGAATFLWDISAITGTWAVALYLNIGADSIKIAELTGRTTTGLVRIPLTSDFSAVKMAIPQPTSIIYTEAVAGSLTSAVFVVYGE